MEKHKAIIIGERKIYKTAGGIDTFWDYNNKLNVIIDKPILSKGDLLYLNDKNLVVIINEAIRTDLENTIMYKVDGLYEDEYTFEYEQDAKDYEYLKNRVYSLSFDEFQELKYIKNNKDSYEYQNLKNPNIYLYSHDIVEEYIGFNYDIVKYNLGWRYEYEQSYRLVKCDSLEKKLKDDFKIKIKKCEDEYSECYKELTEIKNEVYEMKKELQTIKSKWWYKLFN